MDIFCGEAIVFWFRTLLGRSYREEFNSEELNQEEVLGNAAQKEIIKKDTSFKAGGE